MRLFFKGLAGALIALACLASVGHAQTAPSRADVTVDDILHLEAIERGDLSPDGRWAVYEKRGPYDAMGDLSFRGRSPWTLTTLWRIDLRDPSRAPEPLVAGEGMQRVAFSPSGDRLLITRLQGGAFEYGVVEMASRSVSWTGLTPDLPPNGASAEWVSDSVVLLLTSPDGRLPASLRYDRDITARRAEAWRKTVSGQEASRTVIEAKGGVMTTEASPSQNALVRLDLVQGDQRTVAAGQIADFSLSPDGLSLGVVRRAEPVPLSEPELMQLENDTRLRLSIVDMAAGRAVASLDGYDLAPHLLRWSEDSRDLLVLGRRDGQRWADSVVLAFGQRGLRAFDLDGLTLGTSVEVVAGLRADWLGADPVVYAKGTSGSRRDWHLLSVGAAPRNLTGDLKSAPVRIAAVADGVARVFADDRLWDLSASGVRAVETGGQTLREAAGVVDIYRSRRVRLNEAPRRDWVPATGSEGESLVVSREGDVRVMGRTSSSDDRLLAMSRDAALVLHRQGMSETLRLRTADAEVAIDTVNASLAAIVLPEARAVRHLDLNGHQVTSWLFLPDPAKGPIKGVIVKIYPGWADNLVWGDPLVMTYSSRPNVFVAAGYALLSPDVPADLPVESRGGDYVRLVDLAIDAAAKAFPILPQDRMVLWGHSFGGYAALEIATRSDRFRSYIASSPYSDMFGVWGEFDPGAKIMPEDGGLFRLNQGWTETTQAALDAPPWKAQERYAASSPFLRADQIKRPVLFLTADMDYAPTTQAERMFSAILRTGGEAKMVTYWGEQHLIFSPANIRDYYKQIFDWLERSLESAPSIDPQGPAASPTSEPRPRSPQPSE